MIVQVFERPTARHPWEPKWSGEVMGESKDHYIVKFTPRHADQTSWNRNVPKNSRFIKAEPLKGAVA